MAAILTDYTREGDIVCDPCCGAGTTLLAAKLLGRRYIGGDISDEHAEIARERLRSTPTRDKAGTLALFREETG
jgi:site-specific DNA-methyltransferase (adenine-specific)